MKNRREALKNQWFLEDWIGKFKFIGTIEFIQCIQFLLSANKHQHTSEGLVIYDLLNYNQLKIDCQ